MATAVARMAIVETLGKGQPLREFTHRYFWPHVVVTTDGCWPFTGRINSKRGGYGQINWRRNGLHGTLYAHQLVYWLFRGAMAPGLEVDHLCRNRRCVNPAHLEAVTHAENMRRAIGFNIKTHCRRGHALTDDNLCFRRGRRNGCKTCKRVAGAAYYRQQRRAT